MGAKCDGKLGPARECKKCGKVAKPYPAGSTYNADRPEGDSCYRGGPKHPDVVAENARRDALPRATGHDCKHPTVTMHLDNRVAVCPDCLARVGRLVWTNTNGKLAFTWTHTTTQQEL